MTQVWPSRDGKGLLGYSEVRKLMRDMDNCVDATVTKTGRLVSTVWCILEGRLAGHPVFETRVFTSAEPTGSSEQLEQVRYVTEEAARRGHAEAVARWEDPALDATFRLGGLS